MPHTFKSSNTWGMFWFLHKPLSKQVKRRSTHYQRFCLMFCCRLGCLCCDCSCCWLLVGSAFCRYSDFCLRWTFLPVSSTHYLLRLIEMMVSVAAKAAKLCLIGWRLDTPFQLSTVNRFRNSAQGFVYSIPLSSYPRYDAFKIFTELWDKVS